MALCIYRTDLNDFKTHELRKLLYVKPKEEAWMKRGNASWANKGTDDKSLTLIREEGDLVYIPLCFGMHYFKKNNDDNPYARVQMKFTGSIRDVQKPYINQAIDHLNTKRVTTLNMRPGFGKTTIASAISCSIGLLTVVLIRNKTLYPQWAKTYKERTTASTWSVGEENPPQTVDVIICLWKRVNKISKELRDMVGTLIIDEAHRFNNREGVSSMLHFPAKFIIAATATFEKRNEMHSCMEAFVGRDKVSNDQKVEFTITKYETGLVIEKTKRGNITNWTKLNQDILYNKERNDIAIEVILKAIGLGRKILIFTNEVRHVSVIHELLKEKGIESCDWLTGSKSTYKDSTVLVSNPQKAGEGFDEEMFCEDFGGRRIDTVVLLASFKDIALLYQVCGRAFRALNPWIIDFVDKVDTIERQYKEREWWYLRNGGTLSVERYIRK